MSHGALDSRSADELLGMFMQINRDGQTILMVTHSVKAARHGGGGSCSSRTGKCSTSSTEAA